MKNKVYKKSGFLAGDIFIAVLVLLTAAVMSIGFTAGGQPKENKTAVIYIDGEVFQKMRLNEDKYILINHDGAKNIDMAIEISDNTIKIRQSNCKNQICVKSGSINTQNQIIACIPNKIYILIENESDSKNNGFDTVIG